MGLELILFLFFVLFVFFGFFIKSVCDQNEKIEDTEMQRNFSGKVTSLPNTVHHGSDDSLLYRLFSTVAASHM